MYYYIILGLQFYCLYHAYKHKNNFYWYFIIFFIPLLGCIVYLITHVIQKRDVNAITEELTTIINPTKKVKDLENKITFSDTFQNRIDLADAYAEINDYDAAILNYEVALQNENFKNNSHTINKLIHSYYKIKNYKKVIENAKKIELEKEFVDSNFYYALALEKNNQISEAETAFQKIDRRFSNYDERLTLAKFYLRQQKITEAKELLKEMKDEINSMAKTNARKYKSILTEVEKIQNEI